MEKKMSIPVEVICKNIPVEFSIYLNYCKSLKFEDKPDYLFLRKLFKNLFKKNNFEKDFYYDWLLSDCIKESTLNNPNKIPIVINLDKEDNYSSKIDVSGMNKIFIDQKKTINNNGEGEYSSNKSYTESNSNPSNMSSFSINEDDIKASNN